MGEFHAQPPATSMPPDLFFIDAIGLFFRGFRKNRINWSKIPFEHLETEGPARRGQWDRIASDLRHFLGEIGPMGYNAVTFDDLAHLAQHPAHEPEVARHIEVFREEFAKLFRMARSSGMAVFLTSDILPLTPALEQEFKGDRDALDRYFLDLVDQIFRDFPELAGLIVRIGESDGLDVADPLRTCLHLTTPAHTNRLIRQLCKVAENHGRKLILRTWTVGAYRIGDLIWHRKTLAETLRGIDSPAFMVSMKHGESDFFRHLPLNRAFFRVSQPLIIEFQARREYEGAGECPAPIATDLESFARALSHLPNLAGVSVWCQTGGWHRFRRLAFLQDAGNDAWIRLNAMLIPGVFRDGQSVPDILARQFGPARAAAAMEFIHAAETIQSDLLYVREFATGKWFFRRVRIPPLLHLYWDRLFINHAVRKILRHFVTDPESAIREGESAFLLFPRLIDLARQLDLPVDDVEHWQDFCRIVLLARRYYLLPFDPALTEEIRAAKTAYKARWPKSSRERYRIKLSFEPFHLKRRTLGWAAALLLRKKRGYRMIDRVFTLHLLSFAFRIFRRRNPRSMPKFLRKSAMGIDTLFR